MRSTVLTTISTLAIAASTLSAQVRTGPPTSTTGRSITIDTTFTVQGNGIVRMRGMVDTSGFLTMSSANRARIGVGISLVDGSSDAVGAKVESVTPKGPAEAAGIRVGDIIMKVNDVAIGNSNATTKPEEVSNVGTRLITTLSALKPGVPATLQVRRGTETMSIKVTPEKDDSQVWTTVISPRGNVGAPLKRMLEFRQSDSALLPGRIMDSVFIRGLPEQRITTLRGSQDSLMRLSLDMNSNARRLELTARDGMVLKTSFDALSRLELAPINPELGSYFGATEGVLVISIAPPGVMISSAGPARAKIAAGSSASAGAMTTTAPKAVPAAPTQKILHSDLAKSASLANNDLLNLKPGDVITAVDGRKVATPADVMRILRSYQHDEALKITVLRQKKSTTISTKMPPL